MKLTNKSEDNFEIKSCIIKMPPTPNWSRSEKTLDKEDLSVFNGNYWGKAGVNLTIGFLDAPTSELKDKILSHMNAWSKTANVKFTLTDTDPMIRITRSKGYGNWSYLGTYILQVPKDQPTMNLDSFTIDTPDSEFYRVVRHETGHTLGFPHEHMRGEIIKRIDVEKAIAFYEATQGWDRKKIFENVLTPLESVCNAPR